MRGITVTPYATIKSVIYRFLQLNLSKLAVSLAYNYRFDYIYIDTSMNAMCGLVSMTVTFTLSTPEQRPWKVNLPQTFFSGTSGWVGEGGGRGYVKVVGRYSQ